MRSDNVTKGSERAPNRSLFYALGYTCLLYTSDAADDGIPV